MWGWHDVRPGRVVITRCGWHLHCPGPCLLGKGERGRCEFVMPRRRSRGEGWEGISVPPRPVLYAPSPWLPSAPTRTTSPSTYWVSSGVMLPAPPRPCETSGADMFSDGDRELDGAGEQSVGGGLIPRSRGETQRRPGGTRQGTPYKTQPSCRAEKKVGGCARPGSVVWHGMHGMTWHAKIVS